MSEIKVNLGEHSYVITIGAGVLSRVGDIVASSCKHTAAAIVTNPTVARHYAAKVTASINAAGIRSETIIVPAGERFKTLRTIAKIYDALVDMKMDRCGVIVALGGGVIGDMSGFAAATYMRGIDFVQVPTTLLAQVDASVGGKTGVDLPQGKNLVGAFHQPRAVVMDTLTLDTLPSRELRCGLAEVVKHGIIYDREFLEFLDDNASGLLAGQHDLLERAVYRSVEIKRDVVEIDERESGLRAILNYGHTVGHAIEALSGYGKFRHGEALSVGMVTEALIAEDIGVAQSQTASKIANVLAKMRLPVNLDDVFNAQDIVRAIEVDKKTLGSSIRMALPVALGECKVVPDIDRQTIASAVERHKSLRYQG
ncbi:MAG: 3-dehydroquinate synthase [Armatimonadota bacterium]|nr:3-dehydroquinate synthase [bacterium]